MGSAASSTATPGEHRRLLPDGLRLGPVHLMVGDLDRAVEWYERTVGLRARAVDGNPDGDLNSDPDADSSAATSAFATVALDAAEQSAEPVLVLHELHGAHFVPGHAGLYHVALRFPSRIELARAAQRIAAAHAPIQGASDHGTHEAIYLADPFGNGLELAVDRPRELWPDYTDMDAIRPRPLDMGGLFNLTSDREIQPLAESGLTVGHVHLHVGDIDSALGFYRDAIGFDLIAKLDTAAFVSAGGYHHHLAFNVWQGTGVPPSPEGSAGIHHWIIALPDDTDVNTARDRLLQSGHSVSDLPDGFAVRDPWGIELHVVRG